MKHKTMRVFFLLLLTGAALAAFGDDFTVNLESVLLESFYDTEDSLFAWRKDASHFAVGKDQADKDNRSFAELNLQEGEFFPRLSHFEVWPYVLFRNNIENREIRSLGIWGKFKRMGYNWIDIYPTLKSEGEDAKPYEIPIPGKVRFLDLWVWSANLNYYMEAYLRDQQGVVHVIYLGNLKYQGWRNLRANVPNNVPQRRRISLAPSSPNAPRTTDRNAVYLKFVKFRIWTTPQEEVGNFYIYFNQFKVLTDTFEAIFDGDDLSDPDWIRDNWASGN